MLPASDAGQLPASRVRVEGGYVDYTPTVPLEGGIAGIVRFATRCWRRNIELQKATLDADRHLALAETALLNLTQQRLDKNVAIALTAVERARECL